MINLQDKNYTPTLDESDAYIQNPIFLPFCSEIKTAYQCSEIIEYSSCSWEQGWNIKISFALFQYAKNPKVYWNPSNNTQDRSKYV